MPTLTAAPDFSLPGVDGRTYSLASFKDAKALVVIFSCNHCPYVKAYEDRMIELQREFSSKGVRLAVINPNDASSHPEDSFEEMKRRAQSKGFNFPYLRDETQEVARAYGATHTPHLFVFGPDRRLSYTGKIDDNWQEPSQVKRRYLREALEDLLAGRPVREPQTHAIGCTIKWKKT
ncbi:MAG: thioredoxin family protein [Elusimicrobia bacterium]|nr:thioredoxin family protein [Elusimicrobiota bacterium]